ncbi:MAG: glycosyltransferase [Anaerolineales bacterium]|nr:glycosyltransferase [Anaerolineales bacterium]
MLHYSQTRRTFWERAYSQASRRRRLAWGYQHILQRRYAALVPKGQRVLELGCGSGNLLAALQPGFGVGVDLSAAALHSARTQHPHLHWVQADAQALPFDGPFDVIILSDLVNDLWDVQLLLERLQKLCHRRTRIILNTYSRLWQLPLGIAELLGLKRRTLPQNWFTLEDLKNLLRLTDYEAVTSTAEILLPLEIPLVSGLLNGFLAKLPFFNIFALTNFLIARPLRGHMTVAPSVSLVIPARNEAGNIPAIFARVPQLAGDVEFIFVEGHSKDDTYQVIQREMQQHPEIKSTLLKQTGVGKANAVWQGFAAATNDILVILDSDLSVPPEDLSRFYEAIASGKGEFINGTRLVYPMEARAMQTANIVGNKAFSLIFSWLLGQPVKDTLCGTKVLLRHDFELLKQEYALFNKVDPFGDFDLLLGAATLNLKIVDLPVRYRERTYGQTNIQRWRHGLMLARITLAALLTYKFIP